MSHSHDTTPRVSPRTGLPIIPKGPPLPTQRCGDSPPPGLIHAVDLFNAREFWEAHETLEELWRGEIDPVRSLYQGILLVGVGLHHLQRGNYRGATAKLRAGLERLRPYGPVCQGVDVARLIEEAARCLAAILAAGPAGITTVGTAAIPRITLVSSAGS